MPAGRAGRPIPEWLLLLAAAALVTATCGDRAPVPRIAVAAVVPAPAPVAAPLPPPPEPEPREPTCGLAGMPECPLQHWMDRQLSGPLSREDYPRLVQAFRDLAVAAPPGYGGWAHWAEGGAFAAEREDGEAVRKACAGCHDGYRERYRKTMRDRPLPAADPP